MLIHHLFRRLRAPQTPSSQKITIVAPMISDFTPPNMRDFVTIDGTNLKGAVLDANSFLLRRGKNEPLNTVRSPAKMPPR